MDAFLSGPWHHYILVERTDFAAFKSLAGPRRSILQIESLLPRWIIRISRMPFLSHRSLWLSLKSGPMIGWQIQQLLKLGMAFNLQEPGMILCDSDMFFVKPSDVEQWTENERIRFYKSWKKYTLAESPNPNYTLAALKKLNLDQSIFPCPSYIDNAVTWHAGTVRQMCTSIENASGRDWRVVLSRQMMISEYTLYGLFADNLLADKSCLSETSQSLCKTLWHKRPLSDAELADFCETTLPHEVALGFQSFLGVEIGRLNSQFERAIKRFEKGVDQPAND